ncbi:MAG: BamA/TamA family outer membrane protein [Bacteroidota bacterium]|nr:BamA/TamA family outer membrane protein [Ferruginibacter sp.]
MGRLLLYGVMLIAIFSSCSVRRFLPEGERLYRGPSIEVERMSNTKTSERQIRKQLNLAVRPKANKFFLGQPYKVWWWYVIGEPKREKGIKAFFRNKLGAPPVLSSKINAKNTAENMQAFLENRGHFHSTVTGDTINESYFVKAVYKAKVYPEYTIKDVIWVSDSSDLMKQLQRRQRRGILKTGNPYRLSDIEAETDRLDAYIKTRGYYYFNPTYIMAYADSTIGNNQVNIYLNIKQTTPENARHAYKINHIMLFPNYTLLLPPPDTSKLGTFNYDNLLIRDTVYKFKPAMFKKVITYRPGQLYNSRDQNTTLNRLINLGTFKFVKNRYEQVRDSADPYRLNVYYYLTPAKKKSLQGEIDAFSKENKYVGTQLSLNWRNRNAFRGAELLAFRAYGGLELSFSDTLKNSNNFRLGGEASLTVPRYIVPFFKIRESNLYPPRTRLLLGYEFFKKQLYYTKNIFRFQYEFNWRESSNKEHFLAPLAVAFINAANVTDSFRKQALFNPSLLTNIQSEIIMGTYYNYTFNTANPFARRQWYFRGGLDFAGNLAGLVSGARTPRQMEIFNTPFAQFVKADVDLRYQIKLRNKWDWASRFQVGIGLPYHNSNALPFSKQYIIGGSATLRGFRSRQIGPGSYLPTAADQRYFQVIGGDYRLQLNTEVRIPLVAKLSGAVFLDIGNIWTKDTLLFGKAGQLKKDFYKELAIASGAGLRFDAGVILLRVDIGIPLRKPFYPEKERWVINKIALGDKAWRQENFIVNIALGYPF